MAKMTLVDRLMFASLGSPPPIFDLTNLIGLSNDEVRAWSVTKADEYRRFALTLLSACNDVASIRRLPSEILSKIFEECWTDRKSLRIGHVCRWWRSVMFDTKRFWTDAVNFPSLFADDDNFIGFLRAMLERSATRPVKPSIYFFSTHVSLCLAPHAGRIQSLNVSLDSDGALSALWNCLNSGMSYLTSLTINLDNDNSEWILRASFENLSPSPIALPHPTWISMPVGLLPSLALPSLHYATLRNPLEHEGPDGRLESELFRKALTMCARNLRTLELIGAAPWIYRTATPTSFPALQRLRVQDTSWRCHLFVSHLLLSNTAHIHCTNIDGGTLCSTIPMSSGSIQPIITATHRVAITDTAETASVHCYVEDEERLRVDVGRPQGAGHQIARLRHPDLVQVFRDRARVTRLTVDSCDRTGKHGVAWGAFPHLVHAEICGRKAKYSVRSLAPTGVPQPGGGAAAAPDIPCPELKVLVLDFEFRFPLPHGVGRDVNFAVSVDPHLSGQCAELERALSHRSQRGSRLTRLEFGCTERSDVGSLGSSSSDVGSLGSSSSEYKNVFDPSDPDWVSWRPFVEPLEQLVDGPVVFTGYHFVEVW